LKAPVIAISESFTALPPSLESAKFILDPHVPFPTIGVSFDCTRPRHQIEKGRRNPSPFFLVIGRIAALVGSSQFALRRRALLFSGERHRQRPAEGAMEDFEVMQPFRLGQGADHGQAPFDGSPALFPSGRRSAVALPAIFGRTPVGVVVWSFHG
ncbi:MAG TPA: hypothetical protein VFY24_14375, partial [Azospira sp.]|nr:hypothetical protein [Azospira sp.]